MRITFILLIFATVLTGCKELTPTTSAVVRYSPTPKASTINSGMMAPDDPEVAEALSLVDGILKRNQFTLQNEKQKTWKEGWEIRRWYLLEKPKVNATLIVSYGQRRLKSNEEQILVEFEDHHSVVILSPEVKRIRDEIDQELAKNFGNEK